MECAAFSRRIPDGRRLRTHSSDSLRDRAICPVGSRDSSESRVALSIATPRVKLFSRITSLPNNSGPDTTSRIRAHLASRSGPIQILNVRSSSRRRSSSAHKTRPRRIPPPRLSLHRFVSFSQGHSSSGGLPSGSRERVFGGKS